MVKRLGNRAVLRKSLVDATSPTKTPGILRSGV